MFNTSKEYSLDIHAKIQRIVLIINITVNILSKIVEKNWTIQYYSKKHIKHLILKISNKT